MAFTYSFNAKDNYLLFTHEGEMNDVSIHEFLEMGIQVVIDHHCFKVVNDYRKVDLNLSASKIIEIQQSVSEGFRSRGVDPRLIHRALVGSESEKSLSYYRIFEIINLNRGLRVKLFFSMDQAVQWIKAQ